MINQNKMIKQTLTSVVTMACLLAVTSSVAHAEDTPQESSSINAGLNLRTDLGAHPLRIDLGWRTQNTDLLLVLDPMFWTDGQSSSDLIFGWRFQNRVQPIIGWRMHSIKLPEGRQLQQNLLAGVALDLPTFFDNKLRGQWGFELATTLVKHGANLPAETISFASARHYLDLVNFGMFARFDFHIPLGTK